MARLRSGLTALLILFSAYGVPAHLYGDEPESQEPAVMPDGWRDLSVEAFIHAADELFAAKPPASVEHQREVIAHAWGMLNDERFVSDASWDDLHGLLSRFVTRRGVLVTGDTPEEREESTALVQADLEMLKVRIAARLDSSPRIITERSYDDLLTLNNTLYHTGFSHEERVAMFSAWMAGNDWAALSLEQQSHLFAVLNVDQLDRRKMSVRWTGFITAPRTDDYTFHQLRCFSHDSAMRLWIDGELVMDSTVEDPDLHKPRDAWKQLDARFHSRSVRLSGGQAVPIQIELRHEVDRITEMSGYPMAVLLWESNELGRQIVPSTALTPPPDFGDTGNGLRGAYFRGTDFDEPVLVRLDSSVEFIWNSGPVIAVYESQRKQILAETWPKLTSHAYLAGIKDTDEQLKLVSRAVPLIAPGLRATERSTLIRALMNHKDILRHLNPWSLRDLMYHFYMLPDNERVDFVGAWTKIAPRPVIEPGVYPGWGGGHYRSINHDPWWILGRQCTGAFRKDAETLFDRYSRADNGECNINIVRMVAFASKIDNWGDELRESFDLVLDGVELSNDARATWMLGRAYIEEVCIFDMPRPERGLPHANEAFSLAEDTNVRFWALQEIAARLVSLGSLDQAQSIVTSVRDQFAQEHMLKAMEGWLERGQAIVAHYERVDANQQVVPARHHLDVLRQRLSQAQDRGDAVAASRYQQLLQVVEANLIQE